MAEVGDICVVAVDICVDVEDGCRADRRCEGWYACGEWCVCELRAAPWDELDAA